MSLEERFSTLSKLDSEVLELTEDDDVDTEIQEAYEFKDQVYREILKLDNCTRTCSGPIVSPVTTAVMISAATPPLHTPVVVTTAPATEPLLLQQLLHKAQSCSQLQKSPQSLRPWL